MRLLNRQVLQNDHNIFFSDDRSGLCLPAVDIRDKAKLGHFINEFAKAIFSPKLQVTGSLFVKRYSTLIVGAWYSFIHFDCGLDLSLPNVSLLMKESTISYGLANGDEPQAVALAGSHKERRAQYVQHLMMENASILFAQIISLTGIDAATLWATLSYLLAYWKESWLRAAASPALQEKIEEDCAYLVEEAKAEWFGNKSPNPLIHIFKKVENPLLPVEPILIRDKCCLNYCLPGDDRYCYTCPRINDKRRIAKYIAAHAND